MRLPGGVRRLAVVLVGVAMGAAIAAFGMGQAKAEAGKGFAVSPAFQQVSVKADSQGTPYTLTLTNRTTQDQNFRLSVVDFGSLDEQGGVAFLGQPTSELEHRYGLAAWMRLEKDAVFVKAGSFAQVVVTVENRASLAPGGHYGAVLATAVTDTGEPVKDPRVGVRQVLSSLVLATKEGAGVVDLKLVSQTSDTSWFKLPTKMEHRFQNAGNVHVTPRGVVEVKAPGGRLVARGALNEESGVVLPESFRRYKTRLQSIATPWLPGYYHITTTYRAENSEVTRTLTTGFWYAGTLAVWAGVVVAAVLFGLLIWWLVVVRARRRRR